MVPIIVSADEIKKKLSGYEPHKAEFFHGASAKIADKEFACMLKFSLEKNVILMSGGSASGKTEFISEYLGDFNGIVFDGTLPTAAGAEIKIKKILKAGKYPQIYAVFPNDIAGAFKGFMNRERRFGGEHFYRTHSGSRKTLLWIAKNFPEVEIKVFESKYFEGGEMSFQEYTFVDRVQMIEFLRKSQYTTENLAKIIKTI